MEESHSKNPRAFNNKPYLSQLLVLSGGVIMNMIFAYIILVALNLGSVTVPYYNEEYKSKLNSTRAEVLAVSEKSELYKNGLRQGNELISISTKSGSADMFDSKTITKFIENNIDQEFTLLYRNKLTGDKVNIISANAVLGILNDKKALGISVERVGDVNLSIIESMRLGYEDLYKYTKLTVLGVRDLLVSAIKGNADISQLSGPIGIANIVGEAKDEGVKPVLFIAAILSISLAVFNILPFPALDGGRIIFVLYEMISRRKVPMKIFAFTNGLGFALLMLLMIVVTGQDIIKLFR